MKICFLINRRFAVTSAENRLYLANAALQAGYAPSFALIDTLACHHGGMQAAMMPVTTPMALDTLLAERDFMPGNLEAFDCIWLLGLGVRQTFLDKIQLLALLAERVPVINTPEALLFLHGKASLSPIGALMDYPETYVSCHFSELWDIMRQKGGDWIVKPAGESLGRDVFRVASGDNNARAILQAMTGYTGARYCLLQRYVPEVRHGEKRVLLAGGKVIGQYRKKAGIDHRGNLHQEAEAELCGLLPEEYAACTRVGQYLLKKGVFYTGLDVAWPYLLEWNVINPGGLGTIDRLGGVNLASLALANGLSTLLS